MEAAELPEFSAEVEEKDQQGIGGNEKNLLKDKSSQKAGKRVKSFAAQGTKKGTEKGIRNERIKVEMLIKKLKKGRCIIDEEILTIRKGFFQRNLMEFSRH